jgi:hypothetical protein
MIILELTDEEALNLRNLLDAAVRAQGMRAAEFAMPIDAKILAAARLAKNIGGNGANEIAPT